MQSIEQLLLSQHLIVIWVLAFCILVERFLPWPDKFHPLSFIQALAEGMAQKVLKPQEQSARQQQISGSLALFVLLLPLVAILGVFKYLAQFPLFFDSLMLLIALRFQPVVSQSQKVSQALLAEKKMLARQTLGHIVLRDTQQMSPMGLVKANIESLLLRYSFEQVAVIFWYLISGGIGALIYRLLYQLTLNWNTKLHNFKHFGYPLRWLVNILQWIPNTLAVLLIIIAVNISQGLKALLKPKSLSCQHLFILHSCGASLGIELGGPAIYQQTKVRIAKCGGQRQVILADNARVIAAINRATWVGLTGIFLFSVLLNQ